MEIERFWTNPTVRITLSWKEIGLLMSIVQEANAGQFANLSGEERDFVDEFLAQCVGEEIAEKNEYEVYILKEFVNKFKENK